MIGPALHLSILPTSLGGFLPTQVSEPPTCYNSPYEQAWSTWSTQQPKVMPQAKGAKLKIGSIKLSAIHRFQTGLRRSAKQMTQFQQDIETNGLLRPLSLVYFKEDGQVFVRDGNHRLVALTRLGCPQLEPDQYNLEVFSYRDFQEIVFKTDSDGKLDLRKSWITPFDPKTHSRKTDLKGFKFFIKNLFDEQSLPIEELTQFILNNAYLYLD